MTPIRPSFDRPPLVEQAITVIFDPLEGFSLGDYGLFWSRIQAEFPTTEAQQALDPRIEQLDSFRPEPFTFQLIEANMLPRCFYHSSDRSELVQVQPDRFTFNWRGSDGKAYPRFEATMSRFNNLFSEFCRFAAERGLGGIRLRQCELANVNIVPLDAFGGNFAAAAEAFRLQPAAEAECVRPEVYSTQTQYIMLHEGAPSGRLYAVLQPVMSVGTAERAYRFELTARGAPWDATGMSFFDLARSAINGVFLGATTASAREAWGETNG